MGQDDIRPAGAGPAAISGRIGIMLKLNGVARQLDVEPWTTLLDTLRESLDLTGTKKGCDHGQCGACTILVDGHRILSCLTLAIMKDGAEVRPSKGWCRTARSMRCSRPSSITTPFSAATARPARSAPRSG